MQKFLYASTTAGITGSAGHRSLSTRYPLIPHGLQSNESPIQSTIPLFIGIMTLGQLITESLLDYFGRRPLTLAGIMLYSASALLTAAPTLPWLFVLSRVFQGLAMCCTIVALFSFGRNRLDGDDAARAFIFLNGTLNIVPALAPMASALLAAGFS